MRSIAWVRGRTSTRLLRRLRRWYDAVKETVMIELTQEQQQALDQQAEPLRMVDPRTKTVYVLVREDLYGRVQGLLDDIDPSDTYEALDAVFREDWDNPKMADYDRYEEHKK